MVSELDVYLFDLRGYLVLEGALTADEVKDLNACLDAIPPLTAPEQHTGPDRGGKPGMKSRAVFGGWTAEDRAISVRTSRRASPRRGRYHTSATSARDISCSSPSYRR